MRPEPITTLQPDDRASVDRLALTLLTIGADQDVRVLEALAATLVNRARHPRPGVDTGLCESTSTYCPDRATASNSGQELQLCRRIARRALRSSLADLTLGATAFHRIDAHPAWAHGRLPVAIFGSFLFYQLPGPASSAEHYG